jgi:2,3-bisphosphoglycerate-independent phosphoglycerate mutase
MKPMLLVILDGWGVRDESEHNAVARAYLPNFNSYLKEYPHATLQGCGTDVGLMEGIMGNSEVGHTNIGAGRIVNQTIVDIFKSIEDESFFDNAALLTAISACEQYKSRLHLLGLLSDAGVHSHNQHLYALLKMAKKNNVKDVFVHCFLDGRDTAPDSAKGFIADLQKELRTIGLGTIASMQGRYYAMDRDQRWNRTQAGFQAIVHGEGNQTEQEPQEVLEDWYAVPKPQPGFGDEFLPPTVFLNPATQKPIATIQNNDAAIFFNFRPDRARQLTQMMTDPDFSEIGRGARPPLKDFVCMSAYQENFDLPVAFHRRPIKNILPEILSKKGLRQYRVAETEKYAHVTYFFNGGKDHVFPGEERTLIPSNRDVTTYDQAPEMSAPELTKEVCQALDRDAFDFYVINFANPDMVGHTGKRAAIEKALESVDAGLGRIAHTVLKKDGHMIITADHGNCEQMVDEQGRPHTQHTLNPVPFILIGNDVKNIRLKNGRLADIAPTILELMGIDKPVEMTGESLIENVATILPQM